MAQWWIFSAASVPFVVSNLASYLRQREEDALMCLYTFDSPDFASRIPTCPFGHLVPTQGLLTPLGDDQVGYRWSPTDTINTVQVQSSDVMESMAFYEPTLRKRGVTFEMVFRLFKPAEANVNVNLFAIASPYDDCTNPGFRVEVSDRHLLVLIFYVLKPDNSVQVCFEQHFYSMMEKRGVIPCQIPFGASPRVDTGHLPPIVHALITIVPNDPDPGAWTSVFRVGYADADGTPRECIAYNSMEGVRGMADFSKVHGNYKLYIGNNGRRVKHRVHRKGPHVTSPPPPGPTAPPTEVTMFDEVGNMIKMLLPQIGGFFLAFNGKKLVEVSTAGISFGDGGRVYGVGDIDQWVKRAFSKLKDSAPLQLRKSDIFNQLVAIRGGTPTPLPTPQPSTDWSKNPLHARYPPPNASIDMDMFFFAIAAKSFNLNRLKDIQSMDLPHMGMYQRNRTTTMMQDTSVEIQLWAFTSNQRTHPPLVMTRWPEFGTLTRCLAEPSTPSKHGAVINASTQINDACVVYTPPPGLSNENIPGGNPYLVNRRAALPFSTFGYAVAANIKAVATVHVFVNSSTGSKSSKKNQAVGVMTNTILISPPYEYQSGPLDGGKRQLSLDLHAVRPLHPKALLRVTLKSGMEATLAIPSDPLRNTSRAAHCGMQQRFGDVCLARDANSTGVEYEITGMWLSSTHMTFRGNWGQIQAALQDIVVTDVVRYAHVTKLKVKIESLTPHLLTFPVVKRTILVQFRPVATSSIALLAVESPDEADCTPLFFVLPCVCEESFGGRSGIWGSLFSAFVVALVVGMWQNRTAAGRAALLAQRTVQTSSEYNAIVRQFKGVLQEPNMHAVVALLTLCKTRHEMLIALAGVTLVLTEVQTMPQFWSVLLSQPRDDIDPDKLDRMLRWYCRLVGRSWINEVLEAAVNAVHSSGQTTEEHAWSVVVETLKANLALVPLEIALLSTVGLAPPFGFVDHFLRPSLQAAIPHLTKTVQAVVASHVDNATWMLPLAQIVLQQGLKASYTPQMTCLSGGCHELMPHALLHLLCLVKRYEEGMVALCQRQDRDDVPSVGVRLEQIIEALGITKQMYTDLVGLTTSTAMSID
ncbi:hypothetical protein DYB32_006830 [Aphanomyces invadans]|uniref:Uncharacterized protein n=1 Tax=Aphanomyces invadans TaxID=157072 RepID=A0A418AQB8_9STRA|nr:hypothetical protein DYB32_006830 [Aphanomyces invadans]